MDKKGMTLVELIAVIAIIAILTIMITPNIVGMRKSSIRSTLDTKITNIKNAAITYANDNIADVPSNFSNPKLDYSSYITNICSESKSFSDPCFDDDGNEYNCASIRTTKGNDVSCEDYCLLVYVNTLIEQGYLPGDVDGKDTLSHPMTGESMNMEQVCVRYDTDIALSDPYNNIYSRKLFAYVINEDRLYDAFK